MRILHIIHCFNTGGAEALVKDYLLNMNSMGIECRALCFVDWQGTPFEQKIKDAGITIVTVHDQVPAWMMNLGFIGKVLIHFKTYPDMKKEIRSWKPDVIHTHLHVNRLLYYAIGRKPFYGQGGKRTLIFHTVHSEPSVLWFKKWNLKEWIISKTDLWAIRQLVKYQQLRFIALHDRMREELNEIFQVDNTVVVNNGIDFRNYENVRPAAEVRAELHIPEDAFLVGHVGRLAAQKNHEKIIGVFKEVRERNPNAWLLLVGSGEREQEIKNSLAENGLQACTVMLSNRGDIPDLMNAMDVFLFPSKYEGLGIVLIEAQKSKLPCIISDRVPEYAIISNYVRVEKLSDDNNVWADSVTAPFPQEIVYTDLDAWDMKHVVEKLVQMYRGE